MRLRLMPVAMGCAALLVLAKAERIVSALVPDPPAPPAPVARTPPPPPRPGPMAAMAQTPPPAPAPAPAPAAQPEAPSPEAVAERAVLEALRVRRAEIETREHAAAQREQMVTAAERRLAARIEELVALQTRLEALERDRAQREEAGLRGLVRLYEGMRPRDAATIFDELDMPVLLPIVDRMREARAAPILAAMRPERARGLTAELARLRAERIEQERSERAAAR